MCYVAEVFRDLCGCICAASAPFGNANGQRLMPVLPVFLNLRLAGKIHWLKLHFFIAVIGKSYD
ncbi:hypothetical protein RA19_02800 [Leisingera sp. ANG-M1]|nr:hypothetical protein RA19_02800 [Leisingera sp. ANG-M1]